MGMLTNLRLTIVTVCLLLGYTFAPAEPTGRAPAIEQGASEIAEALAVQMLEMFDVIDSDGDGQGDLSAMIQALRKVGLGSSNAAGPGGRGRRGARGGFDPDSMFTQMDANGDGKLTGDEIRGPLRNSPAGSDGVITRDELAQGFARGGRGAGRGGRGGRPEGAEGRGDQPSPDIEFVAGLDADQNQQLTHDEVRIAIRKAVNEEVDSLASVDVNKDGQVSKREYALTTPIESDVVDGAGLDRHARGHFMRDDPNRDGVISADEIVNRAQSRLKGRVQAIQLSVRAVAADGDGDGAVTASELTASNLELPLDPPIALDGLYSRLLRSR